MTCLILFKNKRMRRAAKEGDVGRLQHFISAGADVNKPNKNGRTALHKAAENGHVEATKFLLDEAEAKIERRDGERKAALVYAAEGHHNSVMSILLGKKHTDDTIVNQALYTCIKNNNKEGVEILLQGDPRGTAPAEPDRAQTLGFEYTSTLCMAAEDGHEEIALCLLKYGAKVVPEGHQNGNDAPLHYAIKSKLKTLVKTLLEKGADVNMQGNAKRPPLNLAMEYFPSIVPELLKYKPNMDSKDTEGDTPLHKAAMNYRNSEVNMLLQAGANINSCNNNAETPLMSCILPDTDSKKVLSMVNLLLDKGADCNIGAKVNGTPLCSAVSHSLSDVAKVLLKAGAKPNTMNHKKKTPLYLATSNHDNELVMLMLNKYKADPNFGPQEKSNTPLTKAIQKGYQSIALALLDAGADANRCDAEGNPPLALALKSEEVNPKIFDQLLSCGADPTQKDPNKDTILYLAVKTGKTDLVKTLLRKPHRVDPNIKAIKGDTCLGRAIRKNKTSIAKELLKAGAKADARDKENETPLCLLLQEKDCDVELLNMLMDADADVEAPSAKGETPLCIAIEKQSAEVVDMLLENDADVNAKSSSGMRPIKAAIKRGNEAIIKALLDDPDIKLNGMHLVLDAVSGKKLHLVTLLLRAGADVDETNSKGDTPLCEALSKGYNDIVKALLQEKADPSKADSRGTPLIIAIKANNVEMARCLIRYRADIEGKGAGSATPLGEAIKKGNEELVSLLLRENADYDKPCDKGKRPLVLATEKGAYNIVELLLRNGANPDVKMGGSDASPVDNRKSRSTRKSSSSASSQPLIHHMCEKGKADIIRRMIAASPGILETKNHHGFLPLHVAIATKQTSVALEIIRSTRNKSVLEQKNGDGFNALHMAAGKYSNQAVCEELVRARVDMDIRTSPKNKNTALHLACLNNNFSIVRLLVDEGRADFDLTNAFGRTPLDAAIQNGNQKIVAWLLNENADHTISLDDSFSSGR